MHIEHWLQLAFKYVPRPLIGRVRTKSACLTIYIPVPLAHAVSACSIVWEHCLSVLTQKQAQQLWGTKNTCVFLCSEHLALLSVEEK